MPVYLTPMEIIDADMPNGLPTPHLDGMNNATASTAGEAEGPKQHNLATSKIAVK